MLRTARTWGNQEKEKGEVVGRSRSQRQTKQYQTNFKTKINTMDKQEETRPQKGWRMERNIDHRCPTLKITYLHLRQFWNKIRDLYRHLVVVACSPFPWAGIVLGSVVGRQGGSTDGCVAVVPWPRRCGTAKVVNWWRAALRRPMTWEERY